MVEQSRDLSREGMSPVIQACRRQMNRPQDYEEGCPDHLYSAILNWEVSAPYSLDNLGLVYQPSLPIAPFPYKASLTSYFEYTIRPERLPDGGLPIIGFALQGLRRNITGGAPHSICLSLTSPPFFYRTPSRPEPLGAIEGFEAGDVVGIGITKVPREYLDETYPMEPSFDDRDAEYLYSAFVTFNGELAHTACSNIYPYALQPFVNYHCAAGADSVNISGSPTHPWRYDLRQHIDKHPILADAALNSLPIVAVGPAPSKQTNKGTGDDRKNKENEEGDPLRALSVSYYYEEADDPTTLGAPLDTNTEEKEDGEKATLLMEALGDFDDVDDGDDYAKEAKKKPGSQIRSKLVKIEDVTDTEETAAALVAEEEEEEEEVEEEEEEEKEMKSNEAGDGSQVGAGSQAGDRKDASQTSDSTKNKKTLDGDKEEQNEEDAMEEEKKEKPNKRKLRKMIVKVPSALVCYHPLATHMEFLRVEQMYLYDSVFPLRTYCYQPLEVDESLAPGYRTWERSSKLSIEAVTDFANSIEAFPLPKNKVAELLSRYGWMETVPPAVEWPRSKTEIANMIRTSTVMSYLHLLAKEIAFRLSSPNSGGASETFVPPELYMSARMLLLLIAPQYNDPLRNMSAVSEYSLLHFEMLYDTWRRRRAMGVPIPWTATEIRPFWTYLLRPITLMRALPKWKYSLTTADMPNYAQELLTKMGPQHLNLRTFIVNGLVHLPFSIVPSRDNLDVAPMLLETLQGMYLARRLVRSKYELCKVGLASSCKLLAQTIQEEEDDSSKKKKKKKKAKKNKQDSFGQAEQAELSAQEMASALLWLFGDVPEINDIIGISLPPVPFSTRLSSMLGNLIWTVPDPLLLI